MLCNQTLMLNGALSISYVANPVPPIHDDEVLIEVKETGICGSDIHFYVEGKLGDKIVTEPIGLGHESSGIIVEVGSKVTRTRIGERVAIEPWTSCRICEYCKSGSYQLCARCSVFDTPRRGTLTLYYKLPAHLAYKLPENLTFEDGAMMEPLAVVVHAVFTIAKTRPGQSIAVFGCGTIGLLCMAVARTLCASRIIAVDNNMQRLQFAATYAATDIFEPPLLRAGESKTKYSERTATLLKKMFKDDKDRGGVDIVIEATGAETCIQMAAFVVKPGGTYVQVGIGVTEAVIPMGVLLTKEVTMKGSSRYGPGDYSLAIALASSGKIDLKPLVTHRFEFADAAAAFETTRAGVDKDGNPVLKTIISGPRSIA